MSLVLDTLIALISLVFLAILGLITAAAIPALFSPLAAVFLDLILSERRRRKSA